MVDNQTEGIEGGKAEHASDVIGTYGPVQWRILFFLTLVYMMAPFSNHTMLLFAPTMHFYCNYRNSSGHLIASPNACTYTLNDNVHKCSNFTYEMTFHKRTMTNEFDLVCDRSWHVSFTGSVHQIGYAASAVIMGYLSDAHGRTVAAKIAIVIEIIAGFGQAFAPTIYWFFFARFFVGLGASGRYFTGLVLVTEWFGPKFRAQAGGLYEYGFRVMGMAMPWIFYAIADYKVMQISASTAEIFLFFIYWAMILESPHWLLTHKKYDQLDKTLTKAAKAKGKLSDDEIKKRIEEVKEHSIREFEEEKKKQEDQQGIAAVWRDRKLFRVSLIIYFTHFAQSFINYGSGFNFQNLGGNMYINGLVLGIVSLFINPIFVVVVNMFPRRTFLLGTLGIEVLGLIGLLIATLLDAHYVFNVFFFFTYQTFARAMKSTFNLYSTETFPTSMRQSSVGVCSLFSRCGSIIAPFMREVSLQTSLTVVTAIFLTLAVAEFTLLWFIPETRDLQLPDTVAQKKKQLQQQTSVSSQKYDSRG